MTLALHIMPYWYFDAMSPAWGHNPDPGVVAHVRVAVDERVRRAAGHRHAVGVDLRQPVRAFPESQRADRGARRELGAAHVDAHGQEPGDGPQRAVDRRQARRPSVQDLPAVRAGGSVSGGQHPVDRGEPRWRCELSRDGVGLSPRRRASPSRRTSRSCSTLSTTPRSERSCAATPKRSSIADSFRRMRGGRARTTYHRSYDECGFRPCQCPRAEDS